FPLVSSLFPYTTLFRSPVWSGYSARYECAISPLQLSQHRIHSHCFALRGSPRRLCHVHVRSLRTRETSWASMLPARHGESLIMRSEEHTSELQSRFDIV